MCRGCVVVFFNYSNCVSDGNTAAAQVTRPVYYQARRANPSCLYITLSGHV